MLKRSFSLSVATVLLHAFLASPLLVECVRTDGRHLIEIVGCDPCYVPHDAIHSPEMPGADVTTIADQSKSGGSCTDRFFENPSYTRQSLYRSMFARLFLSGCKWTPDADVMEFGYELIRKDPLSCISSSSQKLNLRI